MELAGLFGDVRAVGLDGQLVEDSGRRRSSGAQAPEEPNHARANGVAAVRSMAGSLVE